MDDAMEVLEIAEDLLNTPWAQLIVGIFVTLVVVAGVVIVLTFIFFGERRGGVERL